MSEYERKGYIIFIGQLLFVVFVYIVLFAILAHSKAQSQVPFRLEKIGSYNSFEYNADVIKDTETGCEYIVYYIKDKAVATTPRYMSTGLGPVVKC